MEDFEFSVEISDRDWECFFTECEECNLLPPSLAGVDDSGMSDIDDAGSIFAKSFQKVEPTAGFSEASHPIADLSGCEGSPVDHYLSKHTIAGMESILSGSEEDLHLQSVNIFFERLKNAAEAEALTEPRQAGAERKREAIKEDGRCSDGEQSNSATFTEDILKVNSLSATGETAVAETIKPVDGFNNTMKTMEKDEPGSCVSPEPAGSHSVLKISKSARPGACDEIRVNEASQWSRSHDSLNGAENTTHTNEAIKVEMSTHFDNEGLLTHQFILGKSCSSDSWSHLEMLANVKLKEDLNDAESDTMSVVKTASQESSPSGSRRKRRKRRRLGVEPAESERRHERQALVKPSDSEEEQYAWRGGKGLCVSEDIDLFNLHSEPQKHFMSSLSAYLPSDKEIKGKDLSHCCAASESQDHYSREDIYRQARYKPTGLAENNTTNDGPVTPQSQTVVSAPNSGGNIRHLQPCFTLQIEESGGENKNSGLLVSMSNSPDSKSDQMIETAIGGGKEARVGSLQRSNEMINSIICWENERSCTAEIKSMTPSILPSTESNDSTAEVSQSGRLSAAKSILADDAGNSGEHRDTPCQSKAEPQQQMEIGSYFIGHCSSTQQKPHFPFSEASTSASDIHNAKPKQMNATACSFLEVSPQVKCVKSILNTSKSLPDACCPSKSPAKTLDINFPVQQTEHPVMLQALSKLDGLSENNTTAEGAELPESQIMSLHGRTLLSPSEFKLIGKSQTEPKLSVSEDLQACPSDITLVSSCSTLDTESVTSLSDENMTELSDSSCVSVSQNDSREGPGDKSLTEQEEGDGPKCQPVSNDATGSKCDLMLLTEDAVTASKAGGEPENSDHTVFAISSFWSEMEKLTIKDILDLRMSRKVPSHGYLPPLQESESTDASALTGSALFTELDKPEQTSDDASCDPDCVESSARSVSSKQVLWESDPVIYTDNMMTSVNDISQPAAPGSDQTGLRKINKNRSVQNLHALESVSYPWKGQTLQTLHEEELEKEYFTDGHLPKNDQGEDCVAPSATEGYSISLSGIFQYLFGQKQPPPSQSATDDTATFYTDGDSVPETYDQFFSEFDMESFFSPFITAEEQVKDNLVPVFSHSRSHNPELQFPEAYEHFFASSSSDDSSLESDEEDSTGPVRVVNRFSRTSSTSKFPTDMYDSFFTDRDLKQNFFWKSTFSFRNISFTGSSVKQQTLSDALVPVKRTSGSFHRTVHAVNALGNWDVMSADPILYSFEDRFSRELVWQRFRSEALQTTVSNLSKSKIKQGMRDCQ